jgi:hypothetical protein
VDLKVPVDTNRMAVSSIVQDTTITREMEATVADTTINAVTIVVEIEAATVVVAIKVIINVEATVITKVETGLHTRDNLKVNSR